ncbi:MAG TPA: penicillin-binding protein 1C [Thermoanaerobaculia bacterium]|nr:penicillin-binding protein 1C [Thermoanaerobaculia bacterium]
MTIRRRILATLAVLTAALLLIRFVPRRPLSERLPSSVAVYDANHHLLRLTLASDEKYRLAVPLSRIPPTLIEAVLLREDRHFYAHPGANPFAIVRAAWETYARRERRIGGSTITMQLTRLWSHRNTRTPSGKLRQIIGAIELEAFHSKRDILEAYLNSAPYGGNVEGVAAASLIYFGKPVDRLTLPEALTLAVIPQNPSRRTSDRLRNQSLVRARASLYRQWVDAHPEDRRDEGLMKLPMAMRDPGTLPFLAPHFVNEILPSARGSEVTTSLDLRLQRLLERHVRSYVTEQRRIGINNAAAMLVDSRTMQIKAVVGSADFFNGTIQGQVNGTAAKRSPGSALKPFIYALAIDQGLIHPLTVLKDAPRSFSGFSPENFDGQFIGPITAKDALIRSRNIPAVALASRLANPSFYSFLKSAGISQMRSEQNYGLGLVLGAGEVTMEELVTLYAALANGGILRPLRRTIDSASTKGTRILSEEASFVTMDMLKDNPRPDQGSLDDSSQAPVYWKTGTSYGFRDAWSAGIFGPYVLAVWVGNFDGEGNPAFVGIQAAAPLFFRIVDSVRAQQGRRTGSARFPPDAVRKIDVCAISGQLPGPHCDRLASTWFIPGKSPIKVCDVHREVLIDGRSGLESCPPYPSSAHPAVFEFWDSDMLRIFNQAGIPRRTPPPRDPRCGIDAVAGRGNPPQITSPTGGVSYALRAFRTEKAIPFQATTDADAREVFWFVNETFVGKAPSGKVFLWPAQPGSFVVRAVDDRGRSGSRDIAVTVVR